MANDEIVKPDRNRILIFEGSVSFQNPVGRAHRLRGPAYIGPSGYMEYRIDGLVHREDGPAEIRADGRVKVYWINGRTVPLEKYFAEYGRI